MKTEIEYFNLDGKQWPFVQCVEITKVPLAWSKADIDCYRQDAVPGEVMLDIGAFVGDTIFHFAVLGCAVIAYEPNPYTYFVLEKNRDALMGAGANVIVHNQAIMPDVGDYLFNYTMDSVNGGFRTLRHPKLIQVQGVVFDESQLAGKRLCYIKIDTEGNDFDILKSMTPLILKHRPVIRAEVYVNLNLDQRAQAFQWIGAVGYKIRQGAEALLSVVDGSPDVILEPI